MRKRSIVTLGVLYALWSWALVVHAQTPAKFGGMSVLDGPSAPEVVPRGAPPAHRPINSPGKPAPRPNGGLVRVPPVEVEREGAVSPLGLPDVFRAATDRETLEEAWAIAIGVDYGLAAAHSNVSAAAHQLESAEAHRWPITTLDGGYTLRDNEPAFRINVPPLVTGLKNPYLQNEDFSFSGRVTVPVYTSGRITHQIQAEAARFDATQLDAESYQLDLKLRVAEEYIAVLRAERELAVTEKHVASLQSHTHDIEMLYQHDRAPRNDLLAAQVALSAAQYARIQAANALDVASAAYNRRLGRPLTALVRLSPVDRTPRNMDLDSLTAIATESRTELAHADAQVAALQHQASGIEAGQRAQVHVEGGYVFRENQFQSPEGITSAAIGVSWNVLDGGRTKHEAESLRFRAESVARRRNEIRSLIALEVRRAWLGVQETRQRLEVTQAAIERAEENLRVARQRYQMGVSTNTVVLEAEALRVNTYRNHHNATADAALAQIRLDRAAGELAISD